MIDNFITIYYNDSPDRRFQLDCLGEQLSRHYPMATLHVLTDVPLDFPRFTIHRRELPRNHLAKLLIYGLLDVPAMYLDIDIIITRPFSRHHLETKYPIKLYRPCRIYDMTRFSDLPVRYSNVTHYNAGVIWIAEPSREMTNTLIQFQEEFFSDPTRFGDYACPLNDENALNLLVHQRGWVMHHAPGVNRFRTRMPRHLAPRHYKNQTIHYCNNSKKRFRREYHTSRGSPGIPPMFL